MSPQIFVITGGTDVPEKLNPLSARCGLPTKTIASAERYLSGPSVGEAICFVIDLPGEEGLRALEVLRHHGVLAPAILVADADAGLPPEVLSDCGALDVLERPADKRVMLGWIQCVCAANLAIARARAELRSAA
jgi:FixJ family two-component response regulator